MRSSGSENPVSTPTQAEKKPPVNVNAASHSLKWSPPNCLLAAGDGIALRAETHKVPSGGVALGGWGRSGLQFPATAPSSVPEKYGALSLRPCPITCTFQAVQLPCDRPETPCCLLHREDSTQWSIRGKGKSSCSL